MVVENCIWKGATVETDKFVKDTYLENENGLCSTLCVPPQKDKHWVQQISIEAGLEIGSQKRPNSGPVCQGKGAHHCFFANSKKKLNEFSKKCPK